MTGKPAEGQEFDPLAMWKQFQDASLKAWSQTMSELVTSEEYAKTVGQAADEFTRTSQPLQQQFEQMMAQYLQQMNLPSQSEMVSLAERLTGIEIRLDDLDAKMDELLDALKAVQSAQQASAKPAKRKKK